MSELVKLNGNVSTDLLGRNGVRIGFNLEQGRDHHPYLVLNAYHFLRALVGVIGTCQSKYVERFITE